ncbi:hypothetical protein [Methanoregula sp.]|uniref:hypothetical protein n=1 Tax=Methanoregula sp. TaxID=2052170 RepID=UPI002C5FFF51|nr:hypothetical protein [Methanoregula sp.]HVP97047.1 hypothetical protein [Methanoregula sp.]
MSNLGVFSHRYSSISNLSREINDAAIIIKKAHYNLAGNKEISPPQLAESKKNLTNIFIALIKDIQPDIHEFDSDLKKSIQLPISFVDHVKNSNKGDMVYFIDDMKKMINHLENNRKLSIQDLKILDKMCSIMDEETSASFRKFWRKR